MRRFEWTRQGREGMEWDGYIGMYELMVFFGVWDSTMPCDETLMRDAVCMRHAGCGLESHG